MGLFDRNKPITTYETVIKEEDGIRPDQVPPHLPLLPLTDTVLYPYTVIPIFVDNKATVNFLQKVLKEQRLVATLAYRPQRLVNGRMRQPPLKMNDFYDIGTVSLLHKIVPLSNHGAMVILQGVFKMKVLALETKQPPYFVGVHILEDVAVADARVEALMKSALDMAQKIIAQTPYLPQELQVALENLDDPLKLVYMLATMVRIKVSEKQKILEIPTLKGKLMEMVRMLNRELEYLKIGGKIQEEVQKDFSKAQREYFLRQQLKAIQKELGEGDELSREADEYRRKLKKLHLPEETQREIEHEIDRLERQSTFSAEYQVIRTYLDWVFDLPWNKSTVDKIELKQAQKQLDRDHYGLKDPKERIIEYLAVRKIKNELRGPILCFVGPPGVGKTSLGQSIAKSMGRKFVRMSLGGVRDEAEIRGHRRTYIGALPGRIIQGIKRAGTCNPIFMLDEIDKVGADFRGDPSSALLEALDPEQNAHFRDHYLDLDFDLSQVMFITTANVLDTIQPALRDRMEIIELPGYTDEEKIKIAQHFLLLKQRKAHGLKAPQLTIAKRALQKIITSYTREAGVRNLERQLAKVCRRAAREMAEDKAKKVTVTQKNLSVFLGFEKHFLDVDLRTSRPGVVTGLAVTSTGGAVQFIEANLMPGKKGFVLTGNMGDVMKESAHIALSVVRAKAKEFRINERFYDKQDIHLHVPAGAIPKDGPSAGIAMSVALASMLLNRPVRKDIAMTGELTLSGLVLPIGGVKEKVLAARRNKIKSVILPDRNKNDVEEIEKKLICDMNFIYVKNIDEVFKQALAK